MLFTVRTFAASVTFCTLGLATALCAASTLLTPPDLNPVIPLADFAGVSASADAQYMTQWVLATGDHQGRPFAVVDKKNATLFLFGRNGQLIGATPALLGLAPGDHAVPDVGSRAPGKILPAERTTPAGRFASEPGHNNRGEDIVWFDYEAGLAIHRLRPAPAQERRPQRLQSGSPDDNRISLGCVVVPVDFYETVVSPVLGSQRGVVYVLPETQSVQALFGSKAPQQLSSHESPRAPL